VTPNRVHNAISAREGATRLRTSDGVDVDLSVGATGEESVSISRPLKGHAPWDTGLRDFLVGELIKDILVLQIPDHDGSISCGAQPVVLRREAHGVDSAVGVEGIQVLSVIDIPQHSGSILTTGTAKGTIRRDGDGVEDTGMASKVGLQLAVVEVPHLDELIPTTGHDQRVLGGRGEAHAGDPVGVVLFSDGVLALSKSVPELDGLITGPGDDLTVVRGESHGVHIGSVTLELTDRCAGVQIPQTHGLIHGTSECELTIRRDDGIAYSLIVTGKATTSVTRGFWIIRSQFPHDGGLVTRTRHDQVGLLVGGSDGGDPSSMTLEGATISDFSHLC